MRKLASTLPGSRSTRRWLPRVAAGCAASFAWRGHRRTRPEYRADDTTARLLLERGVALARYFEAAADEVHQLFQIREWGVARRPVGEIGSR